MSFLSCEEMLAAARSQKITLAEAVLRSDLDESRLTEEQSRAAMHHLWQVMQATSREYDPAQRSRSGLSGGDAAKVEQAHKEGKLLGGDYLSAVTAEALKTAECNACMKRIVAAPTAGSCGVLPAVTSCCQKRFLAGSVSESCARAAASWRLCCAYGSSTPQGKCFSSHTNTAVPFCAKAESAAAESVARRLSSISALMSSMGTVWRSSVSTTSCSLRVLMCAGLLTITHR